MGSILKSSGRIYINSFSVDDAFVIVEWPSCTCFTELSKNRKIVTIQNVIMSHEKHNIYKTFIYSFTNNGFFITFESNI